MTFFYGFSLPTQWWSITFCGEVVGRFLSPSHDVEIFSFKTFTLWTKTVWVKQEKYSCFSRKGKKTSGFLTMDCLLKYAVHAEWPKKSVCVQNMIPKLRWLDEWAGYELQQYQVYLTWRTQKRYQTMAFNLLFWFEWQIQSWDLSSGEGHLLDWYWKIL